MFGKLCYSTVNSTIFTIFWKKNYEKLWEKKKKKLETLPQLHTHLLNFIF